MGRIEEGTRVMPWADWSEWLELKEMLANGNLDEASERVAMYRLRRRSAVPVAMLSTVALLKQLRDPSRDPYLQRLALSMTIIRLINGATDRLQPRAEGATARSVASLALQLQLPLILVEIRHQASHNTLPRLSALNDGARQALRWLEEHYWEPQARNAKLQISCDIGEFEKNSTPKATGEEADKNLPNSNTDTMGLEPATEEVDLVQKITQLEERLKCRVESQPCPQRREGSPKAASPTWQLCSNWEAWKTTPLGLVPAQVDLPQAQNHLACNTKSAPIEGAEPERNLERDAVEPASCGLDARQLKDSQSVEPPDDNGATDAPKSKKARSLTAAELDYAAKKKAEFELLANAGRSA